MYGSVYRINPEQVLKVFHSLTSRHQPEIILSSIGTAFINGIPTLMPFDVVRTEKGFGVVLELLSSEKLSAVIHNDASNFDFYADEMIKLVKILASTEFAPETLPQQHLQ